MTNAHVEGIDVEAPRRGRRGGHAMTSVFIFGLLIALMLTGMPISIALGMTVLTFIYTMTTSRRVGGAETVYGSTISRSWRSRSSFWPGKFLTHGGVARRMINFATSMVVTGTAGWGLPA